MSQNKKETYKQNGLGCMSFIKVEGNEKPSGPCGPCLKKTANTNLWPTTFNASRIPAAHVNGTKQTTTTASDGWGFKS